MLRLANEMATVSMLATMEEPMKDSGCRIGEMAMAMRFTRMVIYTEDSL